VGRRRDGAVGGGFGVEAWEEEGGGVGLKR
jgi:hypothetical protein